MFLFSSPIIFLPTTGIRVTVRDGERRKDRVERFNNANFEFWKIHIKDYLYQKDLYLLLSEKAQKPKEMTDDE